MRRRLSLTILACAVILGSIARLLSQQAGIESEACHVAVQPNEIQEKEPGRHSEVESTPLHEATLCGGTDEVQRLLAEGADVNAIVYNGFTPLHLACDPEVVAVILQHKPDLTIRCRIRGQTPLQRAAERLVDASTESEQQKWRQIVQSYLDAGAEYDLLTAIHLNDFDRVKTILGERPEFAADFQGRSPLRAAAARGRLEICRHLIANYYVDVNDFERGVGYPIIKEALAHPAIVRLLIENGADLKTGITWRGFRTGPPEIIGDDATVLHHAASDGVPETVNILLDCGADILVSANGFGGKVAQTALDVAAYFGKVDNVTAILDHPKFDAVDREQRQELLNRCLWNGACWSWPARDADRPRLLEVLLDHGADPNTRRYGETPLHEAVRRSNPGVVRLLLDKGARIDIRDKDGELPLDQLRDEKSAKADEIRNIFREYAARPGM